MVNSQFVLGQHLHCTILEYTHISCKTVLLFPLTAIVACVILAQNCVISYCQNSVAIVMESAVTERREIRNLKLATHTFISDVITFDAEANIVNLQMYNL